ncbi:MAG: HAMP domain-containing sensor histidine kinase [Proteobacteria bacterium]|nr:HAMP domain-containing sensor histidine kinase [Pseudomonadota bacterium]
MRKLYLRIYLAMLASLVVFALAAGILWRQFADGGREGFEVAATLAQNALPAVGAAAPAQQAAVERLGANLRADIALFSAAGEPLAAVGAELPAPRAGRVRSGWMRRNVEGPPAWALRLPDGRWLVARLPHHRPHPAWGLFFTLALLAFAVGVGAYPVVRRLTRRLESLQAGVDALGAGALGTRVKIEGADEVAQLARSFNQAAARIETLVGAHKALLANASHELRTPLARIRMAIELMAGAADAARVKSVNADIAELDTLIEEILLASRLDALGEAIAREPLDLLALAAEESVRVEAVELDGQPVELEGDPRLLRRLLRNLLQNAHTHGAPPIELRLSKNASGIEIRVSDHGPGVPEPERERVFEPFYRRSNAREGTGTGLGLALVRSIARRHGGDAVVEARVDGGSCFLVTLPMPPG